MMAHVIIRHFGGCDVMQMRKASFVHHIVLQSKFNLIMPNELLSVTCPIRVMRLPSHAMVISRSGYTFDELF